MRWVAVGRAVVVFGAVLAALPGSAGAAGWSLQHAAGATTPVPASPSGVACSAADACIAVGTRSDGDNSTLALAERWDGSAWTLLPTPTLSGTSGSALADVACPAADDCVAVGSVADGTGQARVLVERWNGSSWSAAASPSVAGTLRSVSCSSSSACTAVGSVTLRWDGTSWETQTPALPAGAQFAWVNAVSCPAADACTAVGRYEDATGNWRALVRRWDGTSWTTQPTPAPASTRFTELFDVSCPSATACVAAGQNYPVDGNPVTLAEHWDGAAWTIEPTPTNNQQLGGAVLRGVSCTSASACTAVGERGLIERWDGTAWT